MLEPSERIEGRKRGADCVIDSSCGAVSPCDAAGSEGTRAPGGVLHGLWTVPAAHQNSIGPFRFVYVRVGWPQSASYRLPATGYQPIVKRELEPGAGGWKLVANQ